MANPDDLRESSDGQILTHALLKLRMHDGLVLTRLSRDLAAPLLNLPAVRQAAPDDKEKPAAALEIVRQCVRRTADGTHRIVADATLALGLFSDSYSNSGVADKVTADLKADSLGRRRAALLTHWSALHVALDLTPAPRPSDRTLRESVELRVLRQLAHDLVRSEQPAVAAAPNEPGKKADRTRSRSGEQAGRVIVIGGAVMDAIVRTKRIPQHETSGPAHDFALSPGGKGLTQAVAAARLGLNVALVAAIGDDQFGQQIIDYLKVEKVDTSLLKIVPNARTPVTGVIELDLGDSIALIWRNERAVSLSVGDIEELTDQVTDCDALLLTFEIPRESTQRALTLAHTDPNSRPIVILTPGQPYPDEEISRTSLRLVDFMVAHAWELEKYGPANMERFDPDRVGDHLLGRGVETLCFLGNGGGKIYSDTGAGTFRLPTLSSLCKESSSARDAFCAALASKLLECNRTFSQDVAKWATAAMACAAEDFTLASRMPDRIRIEERLTTLP